MQPVQTVQPLLAHAFGTLVDLPVDVPLLLLIATGAFVGTAAWLTHRDSRDQYPRARGDWPSSALLTDLAEQPWSRVVGHALGVIALAAIVTLTLTAHGSAARNPVPRVLLVLLWGGITPLSLVIGRFYRAVNPLRAVAAGVRRAADVQPQPMPAVGRLPAAVQAAVLVVASQAALDAPAAVSVGLLLYVAAHVLLGVRYGSAWFEVGDPAEVLSDVVGTVAVVGRGAGAKVGLRDPVVSAARSPAPPGTIAFVGVLAGATWLESIADVVIIDSDLLLTVATGVSCVVGWGFLRLGAVRDFLVPALLPLAGAYGLQLFTVPLLLEGQIGLSQLTDPLGRSATLPDRVAAGAQLPFSEAWLAFVLYVVFVALHVLALVIAQRVSLSRFDLRGARAVQFPLRAVLLGSLVIGLWLPTLGG